MKRLLLLALFALLTASCLGPKPQVRSAEVTTAEEGKATVTVTIANEGSGDGQVEIKVTLRDGSQVVAREARTSELMGYETITVVLEVDVPDDAQNLAVEAEVHYPPD